MNKKLGNPALIAAGAQMLSTPDGQQAAANLVNATKDTAIELVKESRKTATYGLKIVAGVILIPIGVGAIIFLSSKIAKNIEKNKKNNALDETSENENYQTATLLRDKLEKEKNSEIYKIVDDVKYIEDWEDVVKGYAKLYNGIKYTGSLFQTILDDSGNLMKHLEDRLNKDKWNKDLWKKVLDNINLKKSKAEKKYIKTKKKTKLYFPNISREVAELKNNVVLKNATAKLVDINNQKYYEIKKDFTSVLRYYILEKDAELIDKSEHDKLVSDAKFYQIT